MKKGTVLFLLCASALTLGLTGHDALGRDGTCLGSCRIDYGTCVMNAQGEAPEAQARRTECGRAYVQCAAKCRAGGT